MEPAYQNDLPKLCALETYVRDVAKAQTFLATHFGLEFQTPGVFVVDDIAWRLLPGAQPCGTHGPHGVLPAFAIDDFGAARGYFRERDIPIVFEEMLPGLNLLIFLDPDDTPIELVQTTDPREWDIRQRRALKTKHRQDEAPAGPLRLGALSELTIYTHDITASGRFYRDVVGLPAGLSFFGHIHLVAENLPVVLRGTNWQCKAPHSLHGSEPVFSVPDLRSFCDHLVSAGHSPDSVSSHRATFTDPVGLRLHFVERRGSVT
ncbi:MAG TPA: hypothetical protein G4N94_06720 [Caldilineae bacterium]|nr:hypothetical protein [Caldilineae bacterium]